MIDVVKYEGFNRGRLKNRPRLRDLSSGGIRVISVTILATDLTISSMNYNFTLLLNRDCSRGSLSLTLCFILSGNSTVTLSSNGPLAVMRNNMLVFTHND